MGRRGVVGRGRYVDVKNIWGIFRATRFSHESAVLVNGRSRGATEAIDTSDLVMGSSGSLTGNGGGVEPWGGAAKKSVQKRTEHYYYYGDGFVFFSGAV